MKQKAYTIYGNIAVVNFPLDFKIKDKKNFAKEILKLNKGVRTVLEKSEKFKGRLRKQKTSWILGDKTKEVLYRENGCEFRFNIDETYFSPRLSNERKEISSLMKKGEKVFVCFAGVSPFSIVIAKNSKVEKVYSNEINRKANEYGEINIKRNKVQEKVELVPGDIKRVALKLVKEKKVFDVIVMARPQLKNTFLENIFPLTKKKTRVYYYDFCKEDEIDSKIQMVKEIAFKVKKKIKILNVKKAGEIGPFKFRIRIDFIVED